MSSQPQGRFFDEASAMDNHGKSCCPHLVRGPAMHGSPNVFVNGKNALRVGDSGVHLTCCGTMDWKAETGSASVFINGKPAHRMNDATKHCGGNGKLAQGSPNVLVGDGGGSAAISQESLEEKKKRREEREKLIEQGRAKANDPTNELTDQEREKLREACDSLKQDMGAVEHAKLAEGVNTGKPVPFWERLDPNNLPEDLNLPPELKEKLKNAQFEDLHSGFRAALYRSEVNGDIVLAFAGSDMPFYKNLNDWVGTDIPMELGGNPIQLQQAVALAKEVNSVFGTNFSVAGQSLGGALASVAGPSVGVGGSIFNAAGISERTLKQYCLTPAKICPLITRYDIGDALTKLQERFPVLNKLLPDALGKIVRLAIPKGVGLFKRHGDFCGIINGIEQRKKNSEDTIKTSLQKL